MTQMTPLTFTSPVTADGLRAAPNEDGLIEQRVLLRFSGAANCIVNKHTRKFLRETTGRFFVSTNGYLCFQPPAEFEQIPFSLGGGSGKCIRHFAPPGRQFPQSTLAKIRKKRLARCLSVWVPMFADFFMPQEIEKKPDYYNGITDAKIKQAQDEVLLREWRAYNDYLKLRIQLKNPINCL